MQDGYREVAQEFNVDFYQTKAWKDALRTAVNMGWKFRKYYADIEKERIRNAKLNKETSKNSYGQRG
jgi:hypothetical protein